MSLELIGHYEPATEEQITEAERTLDVTLPYDYRSFLSSVGGAETDATVPGTGGGYLSRLYHVDDVLYWHIITGRDHGFIAYVPHSYIMIGGGSGGAPCIHTSDGDEGSIWWADFEKAGEYEEETPHDEIMTRLADNFNAFLQLFE